MECLRIIRTLVTAVFAVLAMMNYLVKSMGVLPQHFHDVDFVRNRGSGRAGDQPHGRPYSSSSRQPGSNIDSSIGKGEGGSGAQGFGRNGPRFMGVGHACVAFSGNGQHAIMTQSLVRSNYAT